MKRIIPPGNQLPPDGWLMNPKAPIPVECSWCDETLVDDGTLILCPKCDLLDRRSA